MNLSKGTDRITRRAGGSPDHRADILRVLLGLSRYADFACQTNGGNVFFKRIRRTGIILTDDQRLNTFVRRVVRAIISAYVRIVGINSANYHRHGISPFLP